MVRTYFEVYTYESMPHGRISLFSTLRVAIQIMSEIIIWKHNNLNTTAVLVLIVGFEVVMVTGVRYGDMLPTNNRGLTSSLSPRTEVACGITWANA